MLRIELCTFDFDRGTNEFLTVKSNWQHNPYAAHNASQYDEIKTKVTFPQRTIYFKFNCVPFRIRVEKYTIEQTLKKLRRC